MGIVNKITIEQVETDCQADDLYDINAYWLVEGSPLSTENEFTVTIDCDEQAVLTQKTTEQAILLSSVKLDPNRHYQLRITSGACSSKFPILLRTYEAPVAEYDGISLKISWNLPDVPMGKGRCLVCVDNGNAFDYEIPIGVHGIEIPFSEKIYGINADTVLAISLESYTGKISRGPVAKLPELCLARYFVATPKENEQNAPSTQIRFRGTSPQEKVHVITFTGEIYRVDGQGTSLKPRTPITCGPLTLGIEQPYTLKVQTEQLLSRDDYNAFVSQVWQIVTVRTLYAMLEIIPRCALHDIADSLYFHCGLLSVPTGQESSNQRCADVRPGFTLRLEQAIYMPQYDASSSDAAGYVGAHTTEYPVSLSGKEGSEYLSFNRFISEMEEDTVATSTSPEILSATSGIIDLSAVRMRSAFLRIQYPPAMYTSDMPPDIYESNHPVLVADPSWNYAQQHAYILFRGRTALTLLLTITVNGQERNVPAGTTWGDLLNLQGIWQGANHKLRWYRRDTSGRLVQIVGDHQLIQSLPLMNGDHVEG